MFMWLDMHTGDLVPRRGDLLQTNTSDKRSRTWFILHARLMTRAKTPYRYMLVAVRWWELEPEMRMKLYRSAERNGGQRVIYFTRYPAKKRKRSFEDFMQRPV